ncbi:hypothetical protein [Acrocarpospora sp. B8E8]|uniref:hypothetical protein n=1 Tax=Acrocarpospora sp. B8E8 TaxID=3153572 RepID=UPI00325F9600
MVTIAGVARAENIHVVSNIPELGSWDAAKSTEAMHNLKPAGTTIQFKFPKRNGRAARTCGRTFGAARPSRHTHQLSLEPQRGPATGPRDAHDDQLAWHPHASGGYPPIDLHHQIRGQRS